MHNPKPFTSDYLVLNCDVQDNRQENKSISCFFFFDLPKTLSVKKDAFQIKIDSEHWLPALNPTAATFWGWCHHQKHQWKYSSTQIVPYSRKRYSLNFHKQTQFLYFFFLICTLSFSCSSVLSFSCPQPSSAVLRRVLLPGGRVTLFPVTPSEKLYQTHSSSVPEEQRDVEDVCLFQCLLYESACSLLRVITIGEFWNLLHHPMLIYRR